MQFSQFSMLNSARPLPLSTLTEAVGEAEEIAIVTTFVVVFVTMVIVVIVVVVFGGPTFLVADGTKLYIGHVRIQIHHHEIHCMYVSASMKCINI